MFKRIEPFKRGLIIRKSLVKDGKVLCVDFNETLQKLDIHKDLIKDIDVGRYVYRCKINIKDFDPDIRKENGLLSFDFSDKKSVIDTLNADGNFDIPLWFLRKAKDKLENIALYDSPLIYQIMGCNFCSDAKTSGCVQCFVDNKSNVPDQKRGVWLSAENVVNTFEAIKKSHNIRVLRISGGEPTLVLDHILSVCEKLSRKEPLVLLQFDTNLSTAKLITYFEQAGIFPKNILRKIADYDPCVLVSIKGTTDDNLQSNTQSLMTIADQIEALKMFVEAGIDIYPCMYNPDASHLRQYMEMMEEIFNNFLLKTRVFQTKIYSPTRERIINIAEREGVDPDVWIINYFFRKWRTSYDNACEILDQLIYEKYGMRYKQIERPGIKISLK